jgi:hypothetical protein
LSNRMSFTLATVILLVATITRLYALAVLPPGMNDDEVQDVQLVEFARVGVVEVLYETSDGGREGLYPILVSVITAFIGATPFGYRVFSVWVSLLALALVYSLTRRLYGRVAGVAAMAAMTVPLWSLVLARSITREVMLPFVVLLVLTALTHALPVYRRPDLRPSTGPFAVLGLILGLGFYIHPYHYFVVLAAMVFIAYMVITRQPMSRRTLSYISFSIVILIIVATPYLISSLRLPQLGGATRLFAAFQRIQGAGILQTIGGSLLGVFWRGDANVLHNVPGRPYIDALTILITIIGWGMAFRRVLQPRYGLLVIALVTLLPLALLAPASPNFLAYSVVMPLLAMGFGLGVKQLGYVAFQRRVQPRLLAAAVVALVVLNLGWSLSSLFGVWGTSPAVQAAYHQRIYDIARYLDRTVDDTNTVVCLPQKPLDTPIRTVDPHAQATLLPLMMDNYDEKRVRYVDCGSGLVLANGGAHQQLILPEPNMLERMHPYVREWAEQGDIITEGVPPESVISMVVDEALGDTIGLFTTTLNIDYAPESPGGLAPAVLPVNFDAPLTFLGHDSPDVVYKPGDVATVITYWRVDGPLPSDLSLFTHILFDSETIVSQTDTISVTPSRLRNRDVFIQVTFIPLPKSLPAGTYQASTGAYEQNESTRLGVLDSGQPRGTRLFISEIVVQ